MTLRENIEAMQTVTENTSIAYSTAKYQFVTAVRNRRTELMQKSDELSSLRHRLGHIKQNTFNPAYLGLFMGAFDKVDKAIDTILTTQTKMSETDFDNISLDAAGIEHAPLGVEIAPIDITSFGVNKHFQVMITTYQSIRDGGYLDEYQEWIQSIINRTVDFGVSGPDVDQMLFIHDLQQLSGTQLFGEYAPARWLHEGTFNNEEDLYLFENFEQLNKTAFEGESCSGYWGYSESGQTTRPASHPYTTSIVGAVGNIYQVGMYPITNVPWDVTIADIYFQYTGPWYDEDPESGTPPLEPLVPLNYLGMFHNIGRNKLIFDKLLAGNFGPNKVTTGLDAMLTTKYSGLKLSCEEWFKKECAEFSDIATKVYDLTVENSRALEQLASLYAAKYAILMIMWGHLVRMRRTSIV